ncbi:outer membrane autotransporter [Pandoraea sputorum]|uniref:Outer membrane autotransporter n=2 Tax=Pandoraea sputorum TaxID=93222 RepID=A0A5E5BKK5_9BURK|nr:outer membrane autotransporter [Pandoraea sputorum]
MLMSPATQAADVRELEDRKGVPILRVRFFGTDEGRFASAWDLSAAGKSEALAGLRYWAQRLEAVPGQTPAIINVGTVWNATAAGGSPLAPPAGPHSPLQVQAAIQNRPVGALDQGAHGYFVLGTLPLSMQPYVPSQLPLSTGPHLATLATHELAHALGILAEVEEQGHPDAGRYQPVFAARLSDWTAGLRDDNGKPARPGQAILCNGCVNRPDAAEPFDVRTERGYFTGEHVNEVLAGASMRGAPVRVTLLGEPRIVDTNYFMHIELKNSLMSHQNYRNYTGFMEAELAVLQDLGYQIDRRNFFGRSVYADHQVLVNDAPYFSRNGDGTAYVPNTGNAAVQGLGLHVYGSFNTIFERAHLLASGAGGAGIRVDGEHNHLTVLPGTRVYADGAYARAVMFAYGRDHTFTQRGDVQALGAHGIAASFDFGDNEVGNAVDYRGSYIREVGGQPGALLPELDGPLVSTFDLTGRLAGQYAAIYLSENGYVRQINVMAGASLAGDIISRYARGDAHNLLRLTALTFGQAPDGEGQATAQADPHFMLAYGGNIVGRNLSVQFAGGTTRLSGTHVLYDARVAPGATLTGHGSFTLAGTPAQLTNGGTLAPLLSTPGSTLTINGDYVQTPTGTLHVEVSAAKAISQLIVNGGATLAGTLAIEPLRGWYGKKFSLRSDQWVLAERRSGEFASVSAPLASPTLTATASSLGNGTYRVEVARALNAYSRYGVDQNSQQVGGALDRLADTASAPLQPLVAALDFSAADGSELRSALRQLSPSAYGAMLTGALLRERQITELLAAAGGAQATRGAHGARESDGKVATSRSDWRAFAMPFGTGYWRGGAGDMPGAKGNTYGVVFGAERGVNARGRAGQASESEGWTLGVHGALSAQSTRLDGTAGDARGSGRTTALDVGMHARYAAEALSGAHAFAVLRAGVEDGRVDRSVAVTGYAGGVRGSWTGTSAAASIGGGWRWALSATTSVGPVAALDYTMLYRPGVNENGASGDAGIRLTLDGQTFQSVRSRVGAELRFDFPAAAGHAWRANVQATWNHELLCGAVTQGAAFAGDPAARFTTRSEVVGRDSLGVQAGVSYRFAQRMTLGATLLSNLYRAHDADIAGSVSATWRF